MIGYWEQASSLAWYTSIEKSPSPLDECVTPLRPFFSSILVSIPRYGALVERGNASSWERFPQSSAHGYLCLATGLGHAAWQWHAPATTALLASFAWPRRKTCG